MDKSQAKNIFYSCYGSKFFIDREYGDEYKKYKISEKMEKDWLDDIQKDLYNKIDNSFGYEQFSNVNRLFSTLEKESSVKLLLTLLRDKRQDSFTRLLYCEALVNITKDIKTITLKETVVQKVEEQINYILSNLQNIDEKYKKSEYMQETDFSNENILDRLGRLSKNLK